MSKFGKSARHVLLQAWDPGLSRSDHVGQLASKLQLPERVTILALDLCDSVMIDTCGLTSSRRHVGSRNSASQISRHQHLCEFHHILYVIPLCCTFSIFFFSFFFIFAFSFSCFPNVFKFFKRFFHNFEDVFFNFSFHFLPNSQLPKHNLFPLLAERKFL